MCRFANSGSQRYLSVGQALVALVEDGERTETKAPLGFSRYRSSLNQWLNPVPASDDLSRIKSHRLEGSCRWVESLSTFQNWLHNDNLNILWLKGPPGCGKSTIVSSIIVRFQNDFATAYIFCDYKSPRTQSWRQIVQILVWQLLQKKSHLVDEIFAIYAETAGASTPTTSFDRALDILVTTGRQCLLVVDSLDECTDIDWVALRERIPQLAKSAKFLLSSRQEAWIVSILPGGRFRSVIIQAADTSSDIGKFVDEGVKGCGWDQETMQIVSNFVKKGANGISLWADLMLGHISQQTTPNEIAHAIKLGRMPEGLEGVYARLLSQIAHQSPARREFARRVLQWIFSAIRPLSLEELRIAVATNPGSKTQSQGDFVLDFKGMIMSTCGPLVEIDEKKNHLRFVHTSAIEFLRTEASLSSKDELLTIQFTSDIRNAYTASVCLTYLAYDDFDFVNSHRSPQIYDTQLASYLEEYAFSEYCALHWWRHLPLRSAQHESEQHLLGTCSNRFATSQRTIVKWIQLFMLLDGPRKEKNDPLAAFSSRSLHFDEHPKEERKDFRRLLSSPSKLFSPWDRWLAEAFLNGRHASPICIAAFFDFLDVVQLELSHGRDINASDLGDFNALLYASHGEAIDTIRFLLAHDARVEAVTTSGYGVVRYASRNRINVLHIVLQKGAQMGLLDDDGGLSSLHSACMSVGWHKSILPELLQYCTAKDINAVDFSGMTPLHHASSIDVERSVELIMSHLSDTSSLPSSNRTLHLVSAQETFTPRPLEAINVWLLSCSAATIDENELQHNSGLVRDHITSTVRHIKAEIIMLIFEQAPDVNAKDMLGCSPLHILARHPSCDQALILEGFAANDPIVEALLTAGCSIEARDLSSQIPLEIALSKKNLRAAATLLRAGDHIATVGSSATISITTILHEASIKQTPSPETEIMFSTTETYYPSSSVEALQVSIILGRLLSPRSQDGIIQNPNLEVIVARIMNCAQYWDRHISECDFTHTDMRSDSILATLDIGPWPIQKIEIIVGRTARYRLNPLYSGSSHYLSHSLIVPYHSGMRDSQQRRLSRRPLPSDEPTMYRSAAASYKYEDYDEEEAYSSASFQTKGAILHVVRHPKADRHASDKLNVHAASDALAYSVSTHTKYWKYVSPYSLRPGIEAWKQEWKQERTFPDVGSQGQEKSDGTSSSALSVEETKDAISRLMKTVREGDTLHLMASEEAFVQDVALYSMFGLIVYTSFL